MGFWSRWRRTFRGQRDCEIEDELQYHLAMKEQDGFEPRAARLQFGNLTKLKEEVREERLLPWLESWGRDTRFAFRQMRKAPLFTLVLVLSLALGIGANSAIFSLVDAALLEPLPVPKPKQLQLIQWLNGGFPSELCTMMTGNSEGDDHRFQGSSIAASTYRQLAKQQHGFAAVIGFSDSSKEAVAINKHAAEQFQLQFVSATFFSGLGVPLQLGRSFSLSDDRVGQPPLVILSDRFWRKQFAARREVLGQVLRVNNVPVEIAGVARPGFFGLQIGEWVDLYAPLAAQVALSPRAKLDKDFGETDRLWWVHMIGRVKPEVSGSQAVGELSTLFRRVVVPSGVHVSVEKIPRLIALPGERGLYPLGTDETRALWILFLLVSLILLIVCANVANLLLSRAVVRQRESSVCLALGAARHRLFRQYFTESLALTLVGGCAGLLLSYVLAQALHSLIRANMDIGGFDLHASLPVLGFTCATSLFTALLCGTAPAWTLARGSLHDAMKANTRTVATGSLRLPRLLVIAQVALSFTVLVAAGLLGRSLHKLRSVDLGFDRTNLVYASVNPWSAGYRPEQVDAYVQRLRSALASYPGISGVATVQVRPLSGGGNMSIVNVPGRTFNNLDAVSLNDVSDGYFETLGVPLLTGRTFTPGDMRKGSTPVIVDDLFVRRFYGSRYPIGEEFGFGTKPTEHYQIIGVVKNSRYNSLREVTGPAMYQPSASSSRPGSQVNFLLRTHLQFGQVSKAVRQISLAIDPAVPVISINTQTELIDTLLRTERLLSIFSSAFGSLALLLSGIGLLGLLGYMVARRRNEIGVRMALGASSQRVAGMVVRDAVLLLLAGLAGGLPGAFFIGRMLQHTLFNLRPIDPATCTVAVATMVTVALLSSWIPAWRAARIDPMVALRDE